MLAATFEGGDAPSFQHIFTSGHALAILQDVPVGVDDRYQPAGPRRIGIDRWSGRSGAWRRCRSLPRPVDAKPAADERALWLGANASSPSPIRPFAQGQKIEELIRGT
jgi:hypothetical protein